MSDYSTFEECLEKYGSLTYRNQGASMKPLIREGRDIFTVVTGSRPYKKYDVVLYKTADGKYLLHRIVDVEESGYTILGDNTYVKERGIQDTDIIGVLASVERDGRTITVDDPGYRLYSRIWCFLYPLRYIAVHCRRKFRAWKKDRS